MNVERSGLSGVKSKASDKMPAYPEKQNTGASRTSNAKYIDNW